MVSGGCAFTCTNHFAKVKELGFIVFPHSLKTEGRNGSRQSMCTLDSSQVKFEFAHQSNHKLEHGHFLFVIVVLHLVLDCFKKCFTRNKHMHGFPKLNTLYSD